MGLAKATGADPTGYALMVSTFYKRRNAKQETARLAALPAERTPRLRCVPQADTPQRHSILVLLVVTLALPAPSCRSDPTSPTSCGACLHASRQVDASANGRRDRTD